MAGWRNPDTATCDALGQKRLDVNNQLPFVFLLLIATIFVMRSSHAHAEPSSPPDDPPTMQTPFTNGASAARVYQLQRSHTNSIYFLPGSNQFDDSAREAISAIALRWRGEPKFNVVLVAYTDDVTDERDTETLRKSRAETVAEALMSQGVEAVRISRTTPPDEQGTTMPCSSEYCRQSYRRVAILFSRSPPR